MEERKDVMTTEPAAEEVSETVVEQTGVEQTEVEQTAETEKVFCVKCGAEVAAGNAFCPKCGHKVGEKLTSDIGSGQGSVQTQTIKAPKNKTLGIIIGAIAAVVVLVAIILLARGVQAKDVTLSKKSASVKVGETVSLSCTINPPDTKNKTVTWTSSNESIAQVNDGTITGVNEGECSVTVSTKNGKTDTCTITVLPAGPDLQALYNDYCSSSYATIASDGSYLSIDSNPNDVDDYFDREAYDAIISINEALELPESVLNKMGQTRSMDGIQSYATDEMEITWTYHPDKGLEVNYTLK